MYKKNNKNNILIISNIISWCICLIPLVLIFSNSIADIIAVSYKDTKKLTSYANKLLYTGNFVRNFIIREQTH